MNLISLSASDGALPTTTNTSACKGNVNCVLQTDVQFGHQGWSRQRTLSFPTLQRSSTLPNASRLTAPTAENRPQLLALRNTRSCSFRTVGLCSLGMLRQCAIFTLLLTSPLQPHMFPFPAFPGPFVFSMLLCPIITMLPSHATGYVDLDSSIPFAVHRIVVQDRHHTTGV